MTTNRYHLLLSDSDIDLRKSRQVELWTEVLDIYTADLVNAVAAAGPTSVDVLKYIIDKGLAGNQSRTLIPRPKRAQDNSKNGSSKE